MQDPDQWYTKKQALADTLVLVEDAATEIEVYIDQGKEQVAREREAAKRTKTNARYQLFKSAKKFQASGTSPVLAKLGSEVLYYMAADQEEGGEKPTEGFLHSKVQVAAEFKGEGGAVQWSQMYTATVESHPYKNLFKAAQQTLNEQMANIAKRMAQPENKSVRGMYKQVVVQEDAFKDAVAEIKEEVHRPDARQLETVFAPSVLFFKKYTLRFSSAAWPLPGLGCFVQPLSNEVGCVLVPIKEVQVETGMLHLDMLVQTLEKTPATLRSCQCVMMKVGDLLWVPHGTIVLPCTDDAKGATIAVWPWVATASIFTMDADDLDLIRQCSLSYVKKNADKEPFQSMQNPLRKAFKLEVEQAD